MAEQFQELSPAHVEFIGRQPLFFVASAGAEGRINVSPKGLDTLRVLAPGRIVWLNLTGSGNETAAHVLENGRMTLMFCSFEQQPQILRVYGSAAMVAPDDAERFGQYLAMFGEPPGARQFFLLDIELVTTSCGFGVPLLELARERKTRLQWASGKGEEGIRRYWRERNRLSLDGRPTGVVASDRGT